MWLAAILFFAAPAFSQHGHDHGPRQQQGQQGHEGHAHGPRGHAHSEPKAPPTDALFGYDLTFYPAEQAQAIVAEALVEPCGCGIGTSVAHCLLNDRACIFAPRQANAIIERVTGAPYPALRLDYSLTDGEVTGVALKSLTAAQAKKLTSRLQKESCTCGCGMKILDCLRDDPLCHASPVLLAKIYKEIIGKELPGVAPLAMSSGKPPFYSELPGHDLSALSEKQKARVLEMTNRHPCPCGCGMTLAQCRNEDPTCETSPKLVNALIFAAATGELPEGP